MAPRTKGKRAGGAEGWGRSGGWLGVGGGGKREDSGGQMERKGDARVGRRREDGMGKGGHVEGEKCQTESKLQRAVSAAECLAAPEANNEAAGRGTKTTVH